MKITLNSLEWSGLMTKKKEFETKTNTKASNEFIIGLLSQEVSNQLDDLLTKVFDIKKRIQGESK